MKNKKVIYSFIGITNFLICIILIKYFDFSFFLNNNNVWNSFWQHIPEKYLLANPFKNIFLLHSQPPFHNLIYSIFINIFFPFHLIPFHLFYVLLGSINLILIWNIINNIIKIKFLKIFAFIIILFNPSFYLYQSYIMYTFFTHFLITLSLFFLVKFSKKNNNNYLFFFVFTINILVLTRSSFHIIFLIISILILIPFTLNKKKSIIIFFLISLLSISWHIKNYFMYGFFGTSSWLGLNLYKYITTDFTFEMREKALSKNTLSEPVVNNNHFYSNFNNFKKYGFNRKSENDFLNQNDLHNINIPGISNLHKENAIKLILMFPEHYIKNVFKSLILFSKPSYTYNHLNKNKISIQPYISFYNSIFYFDNFLLKKLFNISHIYPLSFLSIFLILILTPFILFFYKKNLILFYMIFLSSYFILVSCLFEIGENNRFSFITEVILLLLKLKAIEYTIKAIKGTKSQIS